MEYIKTNIIVDTDIGEDIDDTWALTFLLSSQFVNIRLISVSTGDVIYKAKIVAKILTLLEMTSIPICLGEPSDIEDYSQSEWVRDFSLDSYKGKIFKNTKEAYKNVVNNLTSLTILSLAPMTTLKTVKDIISSPKVKIVAMCGSVYKGYFGSNKPSLECNVVRDIDAAKEIFNLKNNLTIVPLDVCGNFVIKDNYYQSILKSNNVRSKIVIDNYKLWAKKYVGDANQFDINIQSSILYDLVAVFVLLFPQHFDYNDLPIEISDEGQTFVSGERMVRIAINFHKHDILRMAVAERLNTNIETNQEIFKLAIPEMYSLTYVSQVVNASLSVAEVGWEQRKCGSTFGPMERELFIMHFVEKGKGTINVEGVDYPFKKGDIFLVPPFKNVSYSADNDDPCKYVWVAYSGVLAKELTIKAGFLNNDTYVITPKNIEPLIHRIKTMNSVTFSDIGISYFLLGNLYIIFSELLTNEESIDNKNYVQSAIEYIEKHYSEEIRVDTLAKYVALDRTYFYRLFKNKTGMSVKDYIINYKITLAKNLLVTTSLPINTIINRVGYNNYLSFLNVFKAKTGMTPNSFRKVNKTTKI